MKTYRLPFYCLGWVPLNQISPSATDATAVADDAAVGEEPTSPPPPGSQLMLVLGGGGGEGSSGIQNALLLSKFDFPSLSLSDQPVHRVGTDSDLPYRMAVHPRGDGLVCSFPNCCRHFEWELPKSRDYNMLALISPGRMLAELEGAGQQLALAFSADGRMLAVGGEDGHLRVFKWPQMEIILDKAEAHPTVKDLDFSFDANFLVSLGSSGPCRVWDLTSLKVVANLSRENGETFRFCRFSQNTNNSQILYIATMHDNKGRIACWDCLSWKRVGTSRIVRDSVSSFSVSMDGKLLAIGTPDGDVVVVNSDIQVQKVVKKAHLGIVTAVEFSQDSRALVSASMDSTVRVTLLDGKKSHGLKLWHFLLVIVVAILFLSWGWETHDGFFFGTKFLPGKQ